MPIIQVQNDTLLIDAEKMEVNKRYPIDWLGKKCRVVKWSDGVIEVYERNS